MKRIMCQECEGEGEFVIMGLYPWETKYEDCTECRGVGWFAPPKEEEDDERVSDSS